MILKDLQGLSKTYKAMDEQIYLDYTSSSFSDNYVMDKLIEVEVFCKEVGRFLRLKIMQSRIICLLLCIMLSSNVALARNKAFTQFGDIGQAAIPLSVLAISWFKDDTEGIKQFAKSYIAGTAATYALKYTINSKRPSGGRHSFPSGHTAAAFGGATFFGFRYSHVKAIPFYLAAAAVGASRVDAKKHHVIDVIGGAAISVVCNMIFTTRYKSVKISPTVVKNGYGVAAEVPL